eukprot:565579-Rhodomonas_salina.2
MTLERPVVVDAHVEGQLVTVQGPRGEVHGPLDTHHSMDTVGALDVGQRPFPLYVVHNRRTGRIHVPVLAHAASLRLCKFSLERVPVGTQLDLVFEVDSLLFDRQLRDIA